MNVLIAGGGNIGMCLAGEISRVKGYDVTLAASSPQQFENRIIVVDEERGISFRSGMIKVTDDMCEAVRDADIILCTYPAHLRRKWILQIQDITKSTAYIGFFPGYGGAEMYCEKLLERGNTIFALQKVPYVARTKERGKTAGLLSRKEKLSVAAIPRENTERAAGILEDMLLIQCECLKNYLAAALTPGNPLLHTSGSFVYLNHYSPGQVFPGQIYYYRNWTDECSGMLLRLSYEMTEICRNLPVDLSEVRSIREYYEAEDPAALTRKFHSIPSFDPLLLPMAECGDGFVPDFSSRFYVEDIPFGICILRALGMLADVKTPAIDEILQWYYRMTGKLYFQGDGSFGKDIIETAVPQLSGIRTADELAEFYSR